MLAGRLGESGRPEAGVCPQRGGSGGGVLTGGGAPAGGPGEHTSIPGKSFPPRMLWRDVRSRSSP